MILQGHMDMVCEKDMDCPLDMEKEGLDVTHDDKFVFAKGTTLGGDDGIAVAYALALLADDTIPHPPLEVIITVDEEIGMLGADVIDLSELKGRTMINLDSEDEGIFTVSCAGGATATISLPQSGRRFTAPASGSAWTACRAAIPARRSTRTAPTPTRSWANSWIAFKSSCRCA